MAESLREGEEDVDYRIPRRCGCVSSRVEAFIVCLLSTVANTFSIAVSVYLLYQGTNHNEWFLYMFVIIINAVMIGSNGLIVAAVYVPKQAFVLTWLLLYSVLLFLENVVGIVGFIQAIVDHSTVWTAVPFMMLLVLDGVFLYCIFSMHKFYQNLDGYDVFQ